MKNGKNLKVKVLVNSGCTHIEINEQLVKNKKIQTRPINFSFEVFNANGTKNREMTKVTSLEIKINRHKEQLEATVMDLNRTDMFLGYNWLVKHNLEVNWKNRMIWFTRCSRSCKMKHQDIEFRTKCCSNHSLERHLWYADFSKALSRLSSSGDYKRTQQGALAALLLYLYKYKVVCATTISTCPNVHVLSSCPITHLP